MDKKPLAFLCIAIVLIICGAVLMASIYDPDIFQKGSTYRGMTPFQSDKAASTIGDTKQVAPVENAIAGTCALLLVGYLFLSFYRRFKRDSNTESIALENTLSKISVESGRTEYELFVIAAEGWSVSEDQIDADFKNYMADHTLPYYVVDFVRKNYNFIDQSLRKGDGVVDPTSWWDFVKAILIFPGCFLVLPLLGIVFGYNYLK